MAKVDIEYTCTLCAHPEQQHIAGRGCIVQGCWCLNWSDLSPSPRSTIPSCSQCGHASVKHPRGGKCIALEGGNLCPCSGYVREGITQVPTCVLCKHPVDSHEAGRGCTEIGCDDCFLVPAKSGGLEKMPFPGHVSDPVNHPSHYTQFGVEIIDVTEHLNFCRGNTVKYIARAGLKNPEAELEDLEKALWYLTREINRIKKEKQR